MLAVSEHYDKKTTDFKSPAWPGLEVKVCVTKSEHTAPSFSIKLVNQRLQPSHWDLIKAAVSAANALPLPGEPPTLPTGVPADDGEYAQVRPSIWTPALVLFLNAQIHRVLLSSLLRIGVMATTRSGQPAAAFW